jgi:hypothetical protein
VVIHLQKHTAWGGGWIKCHRNNHWHQCAGTGTAFWCLGWWMCPCSITVSSHTEHLLKWSNETTYQGWGTGCAGAIWIRKRTKAKRYIQWKLLKWFLFFVVWTLEHLGIWVLWHYGDVGLCAYWSCLFSGGGGSNSMVLRSSVNSPRS